MFVYSTENKTVEKMCLQFRLRDCLISELELVPRGIWKAKGVLGFFAVSPSPLLAPSNTGLFSVP